MESIVFFKCLSNEIRMEIVELISEEGIIPVTEIVEKLKMKQSTVSHHLAILRKTGIVSITRSGAWIYYSISSDLKKVIKDLINEIEKINV